MAAPLTLEQLTKLPSPRVPKGGDKVHKDECVFCFENLESKDGLYVCMSTFLSFCREHVLRHYQTASTPLFLNMKVIKTKKPKEEIENLEKPTKMAIGVEGGFEVEDAHLYNTQELNKLVVLPDFSELTLPNPSLPPKVLDSITAIIAADSAARQEDIAAWDGEQKFISKHADNLTQLNNGVKVPPSGWKCSRCDLKDNLWMNLTDGSILCGRKYFDGSGGNNHALEYNKETGYPLAVKLGTITPNGADVYSYDEDAMVEDPHLAMHLAHFGINMLMMEKTDKTMTELEIDLNTRVWEWDAIQEAGSKLKPLYGPGYTGLKNLGNSCYMNSVLQVLFTIPDFVQRYSNKIEELLSTAPSDATGDFNVQMAKFGHGILSGKYSKAPPAEEGEEGDVGQDGIAPRMLKTLVGRGHQEFATNKQQDAYEYLLHLFSLIERNSVSKPNPCDSLKFEVQERIECAQSKQVRYTNRNDFVLSLPIPVEAATNIDEVTASEARREDTKAEAGDRKQPGPATRLKVPFTACLEKFAASESVEDFLSPATKVKGIAHRITRFGTFPDYLIVHFRKFTLGEDWVPKKLDVSVDVPDVLDLTSLRGQGLQPGEVELPEGETAAEPEIEIDESVVEQLVAMGFHPEGCRKAVYHTKNSGSEAAMNWVLEHMEDPDFTEPLQKKQKTGSEQPISEESLVMIQSMGFTMDQAMKALRATTASEQPISEESLAMIQSMGFTMDQAMKALRATDNNVERALEWIFSHMDELNSEAMETDSAASTSQPGTRDGSGKYKLMAFISHMGKSTSSGHYVCHILKEGRWVIYNDRKVAQSEKPPKDLGYLYFYQRM